MEPFNGTFNGTFQDKANGMVITIDEEDMPTTVYNNAPASDLVKLMSLKVVKTGRGTLTKEGASIPFTFEYDYRRGYVEVINTGGNLLFAFMFNNLYFIDPECKINLTLTR